MSQHTAYIFCIGRELLEGLVLDRNANFMAHKLSEAGCRVRGIQVLDDDVDAMVAAFRSALATKPSYICTTGGMGPGHDDITREGVAQAADLPLELDPKAAEMVTVAYRRLFAKGIVENPDLNDDREKMAILPKGSICHENPIGTAPAVQLRVGETQIFSLPGVPQELQRMFTLYVLPTVQAEGKTRKMVRHIEFPGRDESVLTRLLADMSRRFPGLRTKAKPQDDGSGIRISLQGEHTEPGELEKLLEHAEDDLRARLGLEVAKGDGETAD